MWEVWVIWIVIGLAFWILEIFTPAMLSCVLGTACLLVAPLAWLHASLKVQLIAFSGITAILLMAVRPFVLRYLQGKATHTATNADALIGQCGVVTEQISSLTVPGLVRVGGESWRAAPHGQSGIEVGRQVVVRAVQGCTLIVESSNQGKGASR